MGHRRGENGHQAALFPVMLDELVEADSLTRVIDAWVCALDLNALGFAKAQPQVMGAPPYDPADLLKLYIWGYLGSVRSSRSLERECRRNVECMWLLGRLAPDHKTIADFRRGNVQALVAVCAAFVQFARAAPCKAIADAGYANGEQIAQLQAQGITTYVAPNRAINNQAQGKLYDKTAFSYDPAANTFSCPAGKLLVRKQIDNKDKLVIYAARKQDCAECAQKPQCTVSERRFVSRHLYEDALQANAQRLAERPNMMSLRRQTVEHPFDFIKHRALGNARLLLRGKPGARAELSLAVLAYNLKKAFNMKGGDWMQKAVRA